MRGAGERKDVHLPKTEDMPPLKVVFLRYEASLEDIYFVNVSLPQQNLVEELGGSYEQQSDYYANLTVSQIHYIMIQKRKKIYMCINTIT